MALMAESGRSMLSSSDPAPKLAPTDHLSDIRSVLQGEPRVRTQVVLARLAQHNRPSTRAGRSSASPKYSPKPGLSARKSGGVMVVRAADVALALADRAEDVTDATDGGVDDED
jgi:DNA segregation ATPase FtsK/SpoIIIE, S-DNA-T family